MNGFFVLLLLIQLSHTVTFNEFSIEQKGPASFVSVDSLPMLPIDGAPWIPFKTVLVALPTENSQITVRVVEADTVENLKISPSPIQLPTDSSSATVRLSSPAPEYYAKNAFYQRNPYEEKRGRFIGVDVVGLTLYPIQYNAVDGKVIFNRKFEIEIPQSHVIVSRDRAELLRPFVLNSDEIQATSQKENGGFDSLIVTSNALSRYWQPMINWKIHKGHRVALRTIEWIRTHYSGRDDAEKLRNYLKSAADSGLIYLLLGGDTDVLPYRKAYAMNSYPQPQEGDTIPADLYFSDLDGTWDANGNSVFGEVGDSVDLWPDIFVGRAPVSTPQDVQVFVNKVITYESNSDVAHLNRALFAASYLDDATDGGILKDMITERISDSVSVSHLYERDGMLTPGSFVGFVNYGYNLVNHNGHGNTWLMQAGSGYLSPSDFSNLSNAPQYVGVLYSLGCWVAAFDYDCIAETFVKAENGGGFFVGNSRYGWYIPGFSGYGPADAMDIEFFDILINRRVADLGATVAATKVLFVPIANGANTYRWMIYTLNLLGDPDLYIPIHALDELSVSVQNTIFRGASTVRVEVTNIDGTPIEGAHVTVVQGDGAYHEITDFNGEAVITTAPIEDFVQLYVWKGGYAMFERTIHAESEQPIEIAHIGFNNPFLYPNGVDTLNATLVNRTPNGINDIHVSILAGEWLSAGDTAFHFSSIGGNDTVDIATSISVSPNAPYGARTTLRLVYSWENANTDTVSYTVRIASPELEVLDYRFSSVSHCGDGVLQVELVNSGHAPSNDIWLRPVISDSRLSLQPDSVNLQSVEPGDTVSVTFNFHVDCSVPQPYFVRLQILPFSDTLWLSTGYDGYAFDFEGSNDGWTLESPWHVSSYRHETGTSSLYCGNESSHSYPPNFVATAYSPWLTVGVKPILEFSSWFETQAGWDFCVVGFRTEMDTVFHYLTSFDGPSDGWETFNIPLNGVAPGDRIRLAFTFYSEDNDYQLEGWYIDNVHLYSDALSPSDVAEPIYHPIDADFVRLEQIGNSIRASWDGCVDEIRVYNSAGRLVAMRKIAENGREAVIPMSNSPSGIYFVLLKGRRFVARKGILFLRK